MVRYDEEIKYHLRMNKIYGFASMIFGFGAITLGVASFICICPVLLPVAIGLYVLSEFFLDKAAYHLREAKRLKFFQTADESFDRWVRGGGIGRAMHAIAHG